MDKIEQQKIKEAKELLEKYAPKGEFLAYINEKEARILKAYGGSGNLTKETNIPSFVPWTAIAIAGSIVASTAVSFMGSLHQARNLKRGSKWQEKSAKEQAIQANILAAQRAQVIMQEKRSRFGPRGVAAGFGSTLMEQKQVADNLEEVKFWNNKGLTQTLEDIDIQLTGALASEAWNRGTSLLDGLGKAGVAYKMWS